MWRFLAALGMTIFWDQKEGGIYRKNAFCIKSDNNENLFKISLFIFDLNICFTDS